MERLEQLSARLLPLLQRRIRDMENLLKELESLPSLKIALEDSCTQLHRAIVGMETVRIFLPPEMTKDSSFHEYLTNLREANRLKQLSKMQNSESTDASPLDLQPLSQPQSQPQSSSSSPIPLLRNLSHRAISAISNSVSALTEKGNNNNTSSTEAEVDTSMASEGEREGEREEGGGREEENDHVRIEKTANWAETEL